MIGTCRRCGCTDDRPCPGGCYWVEPDLCSACTGPPRYWMHEVTGFIRPAVVAYLEQREMTGFQIATLRAYVRHWINSPTWDANPHAGGGDRAFLAQLRADVDGLTSREAIGAWLDRADGGGFDPL